jgi:hypothetical protein
MYIFRILIIFYSPSAQFARTLEIKTRRGNNYLHSLSALSIFDVCFYFHLLYIVARQPCGIHQLHIMPTK